MRTRRYARRRAGRLRSVIELRVAFLNVFAHGFIGRTVPVHFALGDFTQRDDGRFVLGIDQRRLTLHELTGAARGQHHQGKTVVFFFQAIFNGNASHSEYPFGGEGDQPNRRGGAKQTGRADGGTWPQVLISSRSERMHKDRRAKLTLVELGQPFLARTGPPSGGPIWPGSRPKSGHFDEAEIENELTVARRSTIWPAL